MEKSHVFWIIIQKQFTTSFYGLQADKPLEMLVEH